MLTHWLKKLTRLFSVLPKDKKNLSMLLKKVEQNKVIDAETLRMMEGVLQVSQMRVGDVMIPRAQMVVVQKDASPDTFLPEIIESAHSRFPVIGGDKDEVIGVLLAKECLKAFGESESFDLKKMIRPPLFVSETKRLDAMLKQFKASRNHMAIVIDEYGGVSGLITIEDVLEQIVGQIEDEYDFQTAEEAYIKAQATGVYLVNALTPVEEFNRYFQSTFNLEEFETIGGVVMHAFGHLPKRGESVQVDIYQFTVLQVDNQRIRLLKVVVNNP